MKFYIKAAVLLLCAALFLALCSCKGETETSTTDTDIDTEIDTDTGTETEQPLHTVHEYESEVIAEPGCEETGVIRYTCSCGDGYEENVDATGHDFVIDEVVSPTFFSEGYTVYKCTKCGATEQRDPTPAVTGSIELPDIPL